MASDMEMPAALKLWVFPHLTSFVYGPQGPLCTLANSHITTSPPIWQIKM